MRVLITGAGGFIGSHLVDAQLALGNQVTAVDLDVDRLVNHASSDYLKIIKSDFIDRDFLDNELEGHDICYHLASAHLETGVGVGFELHFHRLSTDTKVRTPRGALLHSSELSFTSAARVSGDTVSSKRQALGLFGGENLLVWELACPGLGVTLRTK